MATYVVPEILAVVEKHNRNLERAGFPQVETLFDFFCGDELSIMIYCPGFEYPGLIPVATVRENFIDGVARVLEYNDGEKIRIAVQKWSELAQRSDEEVCSYTNDDINAIIKLVRKLVEGEIDLGDVLIAEE